MSQKKPGVISSEVLNSKFQKGSLIKRKDNPESNIKNYPNRYTG